MEKPYCIQRAKFDSRPDNKGIDKLLSYDYMGSAEFEFGALPASLKRVRSNLNDYIQFQYSFKKFPSKVITVFCKKEQYDFMGDVLEELTEKKLRLKEYCDLGDWVNPKEHSFNRNDFWWDIDQDWFFWKFTPAFDLQFKDALENKQP
jgi:hypothetical protein